MDGCRLSVRVGQGLPLGVEMEAEKTGIDRRQQCQLSFLVFLCSCFEGQVCRTKNGEENEKFDR